MTSAIEFRFRSSTSPRLDAQDEEIMRQHPTTHPICAGWSDEDPPTANSATMGRCNAHAVSGQFSCRAKRPILFVIS